MRANFEATASVSVQNEAQNLIEFCVFRYLARSGADVHPALWVRIPPILFLVCMSLCIRRKQAVSECVILNFVDQFLFTRGILTTASSGLMKV
jgi:hypothetical protein